MELQRYATRHPALGHAPELGKHPEGVYARFDEAKKQIELERSKAELEQTRKEIALAALTDASRRLAEAQAAIEELKGMAQNYKDRAFAWEGAYCNLSDLAEAMAVAIEAERDKDYRGNPPQLSPDQLAALTAYREATK
mgnify:FL=1